MTGLKSRQVQWMELERKLTFTILMQVKTKKKSLKGALILWIIVNDTKQDILSALRGLGHDLFSLLSSFLRIWRNLFDVLRR